MLFIILRLQFHTQATVKYCDKKIVIIQNSTKRGLFKNYTMYKAVLNRKRRTKKLALVFVYRKTLITN